MLSPPEVGFGLTAMLLHDCPAVRREAKEESGGMDAADVRGKIIKLLEEAIYLAEQLGDGPTGCLIERAIDEARATQFSTEPS